MTLSAYRHRRRGIRLIHGDCLDVLPRLRCRADLLICDPPYGTTNWAWDVAPDYGALLPVLLARLTPRAVQAWFACGKFTWPLVAVLGPMFRYDLIWEKARAVGFLDANRKPLRSHESVLIAAQGFQGSTYNPQKTPSGSPRIGGLLRRHGGADSTSLYGSHKATVWSDDGTRFPRSVLRFKSELRGMHPTKKPIALLEWIIRTYSHPGDLVMDPFAGCASTAIACANTGRRFLGIERDRGFFRTAVKRIAARTTGSRW